MAKPIQGAAGTRINFKEIKAQLDLLTTKLKEYEAGHCTVANCNFVSDGLRLSQEVEILRRQNASLQDENEDLKRKLAGA